MRINIENCLNQATSSAPDHYKYSTKEFVKNLKTVKAEHEEGNSKAVLDEFFKVYVFTQNQCEE
jgi:hypothetical protein